MNRRVKSIEVKTRNIFITLLECSFWSKDLSNIRESQTSYTINGEETVYNGTSISLKDGTFLYDTRTKSVVDQDIQSQLRRGKL